MDLGITCRTAVVCACTSGLGEAIARALAAESAHVVVSGRRGERARQIAGELPSAVGVEVDLTDPAGDERLLAPAREAFGEVDILVPQRPRPKSGPAAKVSEPDVHAPIDALLHPQVRLGLGGPAGCGSGGGAGSWRWGPAGSARRCPTSRCPTSARRAGRLPQDAGRRGRRRRRDGEPAATRPDRDRPSGALDQGRTEWTRRRPREPAPNPESHVIGGGFPAMLAGSAGSQPHTLHKF
jgi:hypothetical protein